MRGHQEAWVLNPAVKDPSGLKFVLLLVAIASVLLTLHYTSVGSWLERERLRQLFSDIAAEPWSPVLFVVLFSLALCVGLPATPFTLVGGVVFGVWPGALFNWLGCNLGAALAFLLARYLAQPFIQRLVGHRFRKIDESVARNGFWAIFTMRMIPIVPFNLSNFAAGLTRIPFVTYIVATGLAIAPGLTIFTYFAHSLWAGDGQNAYYNLALSTVLMLLMSALPWLYQRRVARASSE